MKRIVLPFLLLFIANSLIAQSQVPIGFNKINSYMNAPDYPVGVFSMLEKDNFKFSNITTDTRGLGLKYYIYGSNSNSATFMIFVSIAAPASDMPNSKQIQFQFRKEASSVFEKLIKEIKSNCKLLKTSEFYREAEDLTITSYTYIGLSGLHYSYHSYLSLEDNGVINDLYVDNITVDQ